MKENHQTLGRSRVMVRNLVVKLAARRKAWRGTRASSSGSSEETDLMNFDAITGEKRERGVSQGEVTNWELKHNKDS